VDGDKPTKESLREVKREAKERRRAEEARATAAQDYWRQQAGKAPKRSGGGAVAAVMAVVLVVGLAGAAFLVSRGGIPGFSGSSDLAASARPSADGSSAPGGSASPSPSPTDGVELPDPQPFEDSPAKDWPVAAAGLKTPKPVQVGVYRPVQVKDAYAKLTAYLKVAVLDPRVTYQGRLEPVWAVLPPESENFFKSQHKLFTASEGAKGFGYDSVANRFYPKDWKGAREVRVRSKFTPTVAKNGALRIAFVVVAAYWMQPRAGGPGRTIVVRRTGEADFYGRGSSSAGPMYAGGSGYVSTASVCGADYPHDDYLEAWTDEAAAPVVSPSAVVGTFDPTDPEAADPDGCFTDTSPF
jgi:hypothetical protein